jgi:hypothetical protein
MARTLDDTANVFRVITAQIKTSGNTIGKVFIPAVTKAGIAVRDWLINNQPVIEKWATTVSTSIGKVVAKLKEYFALAKEGNFEAIFTDLFKQLEGVSEILKKAFIKAKPFAVELGESIAKGFIDAFMKTELGESIRSFKAPRQAVEGFFDRRTANKKDEDVTSRIGTIMERRQTRGPGISVHSFEVPTDPIGFIKKLLLGPLGSKLIDSTPAMKLTEAIMNLDMTLKSQDREIQGEF